MEMPTLLQWIALKLKDLTLSFVCPKKCLIKSTQEEDGYQDEDASYARGSVRIICI